MCVFLPPLYCCPSYPRIVPSLPQQVFPTPAPTPPVVLNAVVDFYDPGGLAILIYARLAVAVLSFSFRLKQRGSGAELAVPLRGAAKAGLGARTFTVQALRDGQVYGSPSAAAVLEQADATTNRVLLAKLFVDESVVTSAASLGALCIRAAVFTTYAQRVLTVSDSCESPSEAKASRRTDFDVSAWFGAKDKSTPAPSAKSTSHELLPWADVLPWAGGSVDGRLPLPKPTTQNPW